MEKYRLTEFVDLVSAFELGDVRAFERNLVTKHTKINTEFVGCVSAFELARGVRGVGGWGGSRV
jgi:hypothetical protein